MVVGVALSFGRFKSKVTRRPLLLDLGGSEGEAVLCTVGGEAEEESTVELELELEVWDEEHEEFDPDLGLDDCEEVIGKGARCGLLLTGEDGGEGEAGSDEAGLSGSSKAFRAL